MNLTWIDPNFCISPQLRPEQLGELARAGLRDVINTDATARRPAN